jgi:hypothetical protein
MKDTWGGGKGWEIRMPGGGGRETRVRLHWRCDCRTMMAGAEAKLAAMAVKLKGGIAATKPCSGGRTVQGKITRLSKPERWPGQPPIPPKPGN